MWEKLSRDLKVHKKEFFEFVSETVSIIIKLVQMINKIQTIQKLEEISIDLLLKLFLFSSLVLWSNK